MFPSFIRAYPPSEPTSAHSYWLPFVKDTVLVAYNGTEASLLQADNAEMQTRLRTQDTLYIGTLNGIPCMICEVDASFVVPETWQAMSLRALFGKIDDNSFSVVGYAQQLLYWRHTSNFCPVCGHVPHDENGTWGRRCPSCGHTAYPHVTPAILALIHDGGDHVLLSHKPGWGKRFSCIAGFTEPGETLEECVQREIFEEVGVEVTDVRYVGNQPWPFPHQLMVGFTALYTGGAISLEEQELDDARWFSIDDLPEMPPPMSLAYTMIEGWVKEVHQRRSTQ